MGFAGGYLMAHAAFAPSPSYHLAEGASFRSLGHVEERRFRSHHHARSRGGATFAPKWASAMMKNSHYQPIPQPAEVKKLKEFSDLKFNELSEAE
jgi:hypothetical protein